MPLVTHECNLGKLMKKVGLNASQLSELTGIKSSLVRSIKGGRSSLDITRTAVQAQLEGLSQLNGSEEKSKRNLLAKALGVEPGAIICKKLEQAEIRDPKPRGLPPLDRRTITAADALFDGVKRPKRVRVPFEFRHVLGEKIGVILRALAKETAENLDRINLSDLVQLIEGILEARRERKPDEEPIDDAAIIAFVPKAVKLLLKGRRKKSASTTQKPR